MPRDTDESREVQEAAERVQPEQSRLSEAGRRAIQGEMQPVDWTADQALLDEVNRLREQRQAELKADAAKVTPSEGSDWVDRGIQDVPVTDLPAPEGVNSPEDFDHHISYDDAVASLQRLEEMKPLIEKGYTSEDFAKLDKAAGLSYEHGRQRIYDLYYGSDAICLNKDGDSYDIVHGRHRIFAAKRLGLKTVPARVIERVRRRSC